MGVAIPVSDGPILISRSVAKPYLVYNVGQTTAYLGTDSSVSPSSYAFPLSPGAVFQWTDISTDVYAVADKGKTTSIVMAPEASAMAFGTLNAQIKGPVDVSGSSVGVSGSVDASGSTVNSRGQNNPLLIGRTSTPIANSTGSPQPLTGINGLNVKGYASVIVSISDNASGIPIAFTNMMKVIVTQSLGGVQVAPPVIASFMLGTCNSFIQIPVIGDTMNVTGFYVNGSTAGGGSTAMTLSVIGTSEVITDNRYTSWNLGAAGSIATGGYWEVQGISVGTGYFITSRSGPCKLAVTPGSTTTQVAANICVADFDVPGVPVVLSGTGKTGAGASAVVDSILPMCPLYLSTAVYASTVAFSIQQ